MVGSRDLEAVLSAAQIAGAKVVLIGDRRQLASVAGASALRAVAEVVGRSAMLGEVRRQTVDWQRAASVVMARGDAEAGLRAYAAEHQVELVSGIEAARGRVIAAWTEQRARHGGVVRRADATVAYGPIWDWSTRDVWAYLHTHDLPPNPVYAKLAALGAPEGMLRVSHLLDGSRLEQGRVTFLRRGWPALFHELCEYLPRLREFV